MTGNLGPCSGCPRTVAVKDGRAVMHGPIGHPCRGAGQPVRQPGEPCPPPMREPRAPPDLFNPRPRAALVAMAAALLLWPTAEAESTTVLLPAGYNLDALDAPQGATANQTTKLGAPAVVFTGNPGTVVYRIKNATDTQVHAVELRPDAKSLEAKVAALQAILANRTLENKVGALQAVVDNLTLQLRGVGINADLARLAAAQARDAAASALNQTQLAVGEVRSIPRQDLTPLRDEIDVLQERQAASRSTTHLIVVLGGLNLVGILIVALVLFLALRAGNAQADDPMTSGPPTRPEIHVPVGPVQALQPAVPQVAPNLPPPVPSPAPTPALSVPAVAPPAPPPPAPPAPQPPAMPPAYPPLPALLVATPPGHDREADLAAFVASQTGGQP